MWDTAPLDLRFCAASTELTPSAMLSLLSAPNALLSAPPLPTNSKLASSRLAAPSMKWGESLGSAEDRKWNHGPDGRASQLTRDHGKLVITLATTGNINTRDNNPSLPCTPKEMADDMHECIKAGVSVLHIHARNELLRPTMRVDKFRETVRSAYGRLQVLGGDFKGAASFLDDTPDNV